MNKWILAGSLGAVFIITLVFSYGPGYGGRLSAFLGSNVTNSPEMSPSDMVTPVVTSKKVVTSKNVTNVTSVSPTMSPLINSNGQPYLMSPVPSRTPTVSPTPSMSPSYTPTTLVTPSLTATPQPSTPLPSPTPTVTPIPTSPPQSTKININTAGLSELDNITGVGPVIAQRIIDYRITNGPFQKIEDIVEVKGIGDATFQKMKDQITVEP